LCADLLKHLIAILFHLWTTVIAFNEGGFLGGILTLIFPVIGELYWMIKMWGRNDMYTNLCIFHLIGALVYTIIGGGNKNL